MYIGTGVLVLLILSGSLLFGSSRAAANPSTLSAPTGCKTAVATSTSAFLTPGLATSTLTCFVGEATSGAAETYEDATMLIQLTASSSPLTQLQYWIEDSQDNIEFYPRPIETLANATNTPLSLSPKIYQVNYASTTQQFGTKIAGRAQYSVPISFKTKYLRVVFSLPIGSANGAVWAQIVGKIERLY